jgi:hypothetical protein
VEITGREEESLCECGAVAWRVSQQLSTPSITSKRKAKFKYDTVRFINPHFDHIKRENEKVN